MTENNNKLYKLPQLYLFRRYIEVIYDLHQPHIHTNISMQEKKRII